MKDSLPFPKAMGKRVAIRRKELGLTQEKAAERCGLSQQFFASVETGGKNMRAESLLKLAIGLETSADYFLTGRILEIDLDDSLKRLTQLTDEQYRHLLKVIDEYLWALGK